ncbi:unnamed protein product, partial [Brassica rapa]
MLDNQMKTQELDPQRSVSNIFLLDASDLANFPTANIGSGFNYFGTQGLLRSTGAFFLSCSSGLLSITAGADFVTAMYVGLSEALPPTKDCNDRTIEFQNKLGPGKILGYSCDWVTRRNFPRNGTLKFNEKYVYDGATNVPKWSCFL